MATTKVRLFITRDSANNWTAWLSDGTAGGTTVVKDFRVNGIDGAIVNLIATETGQFQFQSIDQTIGQSVWVSNGIYSGFLSLNSQAILSGDSLLSADLTAGVATLNQANDTSTLLNHSDAIVFIDSHITGIQSLLAGLDPATEVVIIDGSQDGLAQIQANLAGRANLAAIHIISHGAVGTLMLGTSSLDIKNVANYTEQLSDIGSHLSASGDILLYGCNIAEGSQGQQFIDQLANLTQAGVAASSNLTGSSLLGGDWILEQQTETIETPTISIQSFNSILAANTAPSFGVADGKITSALGSANYSYSMKLQSDGKIVLAGTSNSNFSVIRYNTDGSLDSSFGQNGQIISDFAGVAKSVAITQDGNILLAGLASYPAYSPPLYRGDDLLR